jgi:hypothetical protein
VRTSTVRAVLAVVLALAAVHSSAPDARAQEYGPDRDGWALDARSGLALPAGALSELARPGPAVGLGGLYWIGPKVAARADVGFERYASSSSFGPYEDEGPAVRMWRTTAGVQLRFTEEDPEDWSTILGVGVGAATLDTQGFLVPVTDRFTGFQLDQTYPEAYGRVRASYDASERVRILIGVEGHLTLASSGDTEVFEAATGGRVEAFDVVAAFPLTVGVELGL